MIKIEFTTNDEKGRLSLKVKGHAGQATIGQDIVCASASILAYTVAQVVKDIESKGGLKKPPTIKLLKGDACITCHPKEDYIDELAHTYYVASVGYSLLAHNYPQYVDFNSFGKD